MGILDNNSQQPSEMVANRIKNQTRQTYVMMVNAFNEGARIFWRNPRGLLPIEITTALGKDAKEVFELHGKLGQLLWSIKPEDISEGLSLVGSFSYNEDGTVTVEPPATEPPATEPPATEPPATEPPATEPPATEPPELGQ